jgi:hypothetical protein
VKKKKKKRLDDVLGDGNGKPAAVVAEEHKETPEDLLKPHKKLLRKGIILGTQGLFLTLSRSDNC